MSVPAYSVRERPDFIPVCRLGTVLKVDRSTAWRRATGGMYGQPSRDKSGRLQVETETVERVEGILITDATLKTVTAPRDHPVRAPRLPPVPIQIPDHPTPLTDNDIKTLIEAHLWVRDGQWRRYLAALEDLQADTLESQATFHTGIEPPPNPYGDRS